MSELEDQLNHILSDPTAMGQIAALAKSLGMGGGEDAAPHLDGQYAAFGKITNNAEAAIAISEVPTDMRDKPKTPVVIESIRVDTLGEEYPAPEKK